MNLNTATTLGYCTRDIKGSNLQIDSNGNLKIADFGTHLRSSLLQVGWLHCGTDLQSFCFVPQAIELPWIYGALVSFLQNCLLESLSCLEEQRRLKAYWKFLSIAIELTFDKYQNLIRKCESQKFLKSYQQVLFIGNLFSYA
ncbi:unnamed protein product [Dovyalis caffra]|uniref:Protein kinase domain-containing protein n=1 Tax=Dovyalis caffra TaxID=77055 RepID=A0AAV1RY70_9ROSI|nr:unnamed protein product [Dovyalis caffra]